MGNRYIGTNDHDKYKMAESQPCGFTFRCRKKYFYDKDLKYVESIKSKIWREFQLCRCYSKKKRYVESKYSNYGKKNRMAK